MKYAVLGYGGRGNVYTQCLLNDKRAKLVAVCDKKQIRLDFAQKVTGINKEDCYLSDYEFFSKGKLADLLIVSTQDADHYRHALTALEIGYDLLLEKPIADSYERCVDIYKLAKKLSRKVFVCHVLRYAPFFQFIKEQLSSGKYGKVSTINLTENVAYWHQSHSYVRGNWAKTESSTPMILAKCCHDLDIISWYMDGDKCKSVSSFGSLDYFTPQNAPKGSAEYCFECAARNDCPYDSYTVYKQRAGWLSNVDWIEEGGGSEALKAAVKNKACPYNRCVFKCDSTAVDHQVVNMLFDSGATAHLTMTAFSGECYREIHVHCTKGDMYGSMHDNQITCHIYGKDKEIVDIQKLSDGNYGHGGGDARLINDIIETYEGGVAKGLTTIENSLSSHNIGYAAERSRLSGGMLEHIDYVK